MADGALLDTRMEIDGPSWKTYLFPILGVGFAGGLGFFLMQKDWVLASLAGILFLVVCALQPFFISGRNMTGFIVFAESLALALPFVRQPSLLLLIGWLCTFAILWSGSNQARQIRNNQLKITFAPVERAVTMQALSALALFISVMYVSTIDFRNPDTFKSPLNAFLDPAVPLVQKLAFKNFSLDMTVGQLVQGIAEEKIEQLGQDWNQLAPAARNALIEQGVIGLQAQAAGFGIKLTSGDRIRDVLYNYTHSFITRIPDRYQSWIPFVVILIAFFVLKSFAFLAHWIVAFFSYLAYEIMMALGFAQVALESRSREIIVLK